MGKPECEPYRVAIRAIEILREQQNAAYDLAIQKLKVQEADCEKGGGGTLPPTEEPPPDGIISGGMPPIEEGP